MDFYDTLGVARDASAEQIRHSFSVRAQLLHPDRHQGARPEVIEEAGREMQALTRAWETLRDPAARRLYDMSLRQSTATGGTPGRPRPPSGPKQRSASTPPRPKSQPLNKTVVECPKCNEGTLTDKGIPRVICASCGSPIRFATCVRCKSSVTYIESWARIVCLECDNTFKPRWKDSTSQNPLYREVSQYDILALLAIGLPTIIIAILITVSQGPGGQSFGTNFIASLILVSIAYWLLAKLIRLRYDGTLPLSIPSLHRQPIPTNQLYEDWDRLVDRPSRVAKILAQFGQNH